jgi:hypothetical protein
MSPRATPAIAPAFPSRSAGTRRCASEPARAAQLLPPEAMGPGTAREPRNRSAGRGYRTPSLLGRSRFPTRNRRHRWSSRKTGRKRALSPRCSSANLPVVVQTFSRRIVTARLEVHRLSSTRGQNALRPRAANPLEKPGALSMHQRLIRQRGVRPLMYQYGETVRSQRKRTPRASVSLP